MIVFQSIIDDCASRLSDEARGAVGDTKWLLYGNEVLEHLTLNWKVLEIDSTHDIEANEDRYSYPDDMVQMSRWRHSLTPSDPNSYIKGGEIFEDEFTSRTDRYAPVGDDDFRYWARAQFFQITPRPTLLVTEGGMLTYWRLAPRIADPRVDLFPLAGTMRVMARRRMLMEAKADLHRYEEYTTDLQIWDRDMDRIADRIEDKSDDRRPALRLKSRRLGMSRMT